MSDRIKLGNLFKEILGSKNVYFQPPENVQMSYPAIRYELDDMPSRHADNGVYLLHHRYRVTLLCKDPDNAFKEKLALLPRCRFERHYRSDNLNHYVFTIYY